MRTDPCQSRESARVRGRSRVDDVFSVDDERKREGSSSYLECQSSN